VNTKIALRALREATMTMLAAVATLLCTLALDPEPGPAVLAVVLCLSLSRSQLDRDVRGRVEAAITLPAVSLAALGVGILIHRAPWLGAMAFVAGMSVPIWLRRFRASVRQAGSLIALPFVVILTTPYVSTTRVGPVMAVLVPIIVAELALLWVSVFHLLARRFHWMPPARAPKTTAAATSSANTITMRPMPSSRMAIQMAIALGVAFLVGYTFFTGRWSWIVLTAYIVGSGNQGRLDVAYKSVLRVIGAAAGTALALSFTFHVGSNDATTVVLILGAVFLGLWLRPLGYGWWALFVTLALSLLQGFDGASAQGILWPRLEEIVIGAIIAVGAAWFVLPVRSTDVMRRRIADALSAFSESLDPDMPSRESSRFVSAIDRVEQIAPAFRASRFATGRYRATQPADWVDALVACRAPAVALIDQRQTPGDVRKAISAARKAMREPGKILEALQKLRNVLVGREPTPDTNSATKGSEELLV
jgi:hypothetical protein